MKSVCNDLIHGLRILSKSPGITGIAIIAVALGIGLTTITFGLVNGLFYKGLPFPESHRLYSIVMINKKSGGIGHYMPLRFYDRLIKRQTSFESLASHAGNGSVTLSEGGYSQFFRATRVTANWLEPLRVQPLMGMSFFAGDDVLGAESKIILSHDLWVTRYGMDPGIIGKTVMTESGTSTVVGVMPSKFVFPDRQRAWIPAPFDHTYKADGEGFNWLSTYGRLKEGVSPKAAEAEIQHLMSQIRREDPFLWSDEDGYDETFAYTLVATSREYIGSEMERTTYPMLGAALLILLIACANVANLQLARYSKRTRELAIRSALGASTRQISQQIVIESLLLLLFGSVVGLTVAHFGLGWIRQAMVILEPPDWLDLSIDARVAAFVAALMLMAALLTSAATIWFVQRSNLNEILKDESRASSGYHVGRFAKGLVVAQVALCTTLLISMGLVIKAVNELRTLEIHADVDSILNVTIKLNRQKYGSRPELAFQAYRELITKLQDHGEVSQSATVTPVTFKGEWPYNYHVEGEVVTDRIRAPNKPMKTISPGYFATLSSPILQGRDFSWEDTVDKPLVCIVNRPFADKHWPNEEPIGKRMRLFQPGENSAYEEWMTVVGVVPDLKMAGVTNAHESQAGFYVPLIQHGGVHPDRAWSRFFNYLVIGTTVDPLSVTPIVRNELAKIDPQAPVYFIRTLNDVLEEERAGYEIAATLFTTFGVSALFLAIIGVFGVMYSSVNQRVREIGVRMALGGQRSDVLRLVLGLGARQIAFGLALGLALTLVVARFLSALLFQVSPCDIGIYLTIPATMVVPGIVACYIPARRAVQVQPMEALRVE